MKKSVKILTLVLSLALLCGALVVAAFAEDDTTITGITIHNSANFDTIGETTFPTAESLVSEGKNQVSTNIEQLDGALKYVQFKHQMGGEGKVVKNSVDGNCYVTAEYTELFYADGWTVGDKTYTSSSGHMLTSYLQNGEWDETKYTDEENKTGFNTLRYNGEDFKYFVMDADVFWADPVNYNGQGTFNPYMTYTKADGSNYQAASTLNNNIGLGFASYNATLGGVPVKLKSSENSYVVGSDGTWSHITFIMEPVVVETDGVKNIKLIQYLAIDGKIVDKCEYTQSDYTADNVYMNDLTLLYNLDIRFDVFGRLTKTTIPSSGAVDNYKIRTVSTDSNTNLATAIESGDLTTWDSNVYNAGAMPFGKTMATIGETAYDSFAKALAAADGSEPIVLNANVTSAVTLDKAVTIERGEYTINEELITMAEGYKLTATETGYKVEATQNALAIVWGDCTCGLDDCDETHPGGFVTDEAYEGGTYAQYYTKDLEWSTVVGTTIYYLAGWVDADDNEFDVTATITAEMCDEGEIELCPDIATESVTVSYVKGGATTYTNDILTALTTADAGTTVTLFGDTAYAPTATNTLAKNITLDLNGHLLNLLTPTKCTAFSVPAGASFTVIGEQEGSTLINGYPNSTKAGGTLFTSGHNATITLKGENLKVSTAALYGVWQDYTVTINIEDCYYNHAGGSDNLHNIYISKASGTQSAYHINIKNAIVNGLTAGIACDNQAASTVNIENSVILNTMLTNASRNDNTTMTVSNSYIYGDNAAAKVVVKGEGNYFTSSSWLADATYEGCALTTETTECTHVHYTHPWTIVDGAWDVEATLAFTTEEVARTYYFKTVTSVSVNFYDGDTLLGTVGVAPGATAIGPAVTGDVETFADGWVLGVKYYAYTVPADATADINVDVADGAEYKYEYTAGTPELYVNYTLSDNLAINLYLPVNAPEGITDLAPWQLNSSAVLAVRPYQTSGGANAVWVINGEEYYNTQGWHGATNADSDKEWVIKYTYDGQTFSVPVGINVATYAAKVAEYYAEDATKMEQALALLQYVNAANLITSNTLSSEFTAVYEDLKTKIELRSVPETTADVSELSEYISDVNVSTGYNTQFNITVTDTSMTYVIKADGATVSAYTTTEGSTTGTLSTAKGSFLPWTAKELTIQVLDGEGMVVAEGTYSLAAYYTEIKDTATENQLAIVQAMYVLGAIGRQNQ